MMNQKFMLTKCSDPHAPIGAQTPPTRRGLAFATLTFTLCALALWAAELSGPAQAQASAAAPQVPALLGGKVNALVANTAGDTLATAIEGAGVRAGTVSAGGMNWAAQTFPAGANPGPYVSDLVWDDAGALWASAGVKAG